MTQVRHIAYTGKVFSVATQQFKSYQPKNTKNDEIYFEGGGKKKFLWTSSLAVALVYSCLMLAARTKEVKPSLQNFFEKHNVKQNAKDLVGSELYYLTRSFTHLTTPIPPYKQSEENSTWTLPAIKEPVKKSERDNKLDKHPTAKRHPKIYDQIRPEDWAIPEEEMQ